MLRPLLAVLAALGIASAAHTPIGDCRNGPLGIVLVDAGATRFYIDDRSTIDGPVAFEAWEETNGVYVEGDVAHSLQRAGYCNYIGECFRMRCIDDPLVIPDMIVW